MGFLLSKNINLVMESGTRKGREVLIRAFAIPWPFFMRRGRL